MVLHQFTDNSYGIGHRKDEKCPCEPVHLVSYKRRNASRTGRHQGYNREVIFQHNTL